MKMIKVIKTVPILKNPTTGIWYKEGDEIKNPNKMLLQVAKVHPDVFSIVDVVEKKVKEIKEDTKKIVDNVKMIKNNDIKYDNKIQNTNKKRGRKSKKSTDSKNKTKMINNEH